MRRDTINVVICGLLAQIVGFVKLLLIAHHFGLSADLDGYYLALAIPSVVQGFTTGAVQTGFVPIYISLLSCGERNGARSLAAAVFCRLFFFLLFLSLTLSFASEPLILWLTPSSSYAVQQAAVASFSILAFSALLNGLIDYFSLLLNAHHRYVVAAIGPAINAAVSSLVLFTWPEWGVDNLVWGLVAGMLMQLVISLTAFSKAGIGLGLFPFTWQHTSLKRVYQLTVPILLGMALANANNMIIQFFSATTGDGGVSTLGYASRLHGVFLQVVIMGISTVLLPNFATLVAADQRKQIHAVLQNALRLSLLISIIMILAIGTMGTDIITLLLQRGRFDQQATESVAFIWLIYTLGLFPIAWGIFIAKYFQAVQKPWVITRLAVLSFIVNATLTWLLMKTHGLAGIAAANGFVYLLIAFFYHRAVVKDLGLPILKDENRRLFALVAIGLVSWGGIAMLQPLIADLPLLTRLAGTIMVIFFTAVLLTRQAGFTGYVPRREMFSS